jgi:sugar lactone lactonase YvrE
METPAIHKSASRRRGRILQPQARRPVAVAVLAAILVLVGFGVWWFLNPGDDGSVVLVPAPSESTATITFAGVFPAAEDPALRNPLGIAIIGERVFVSESDAGVVREFAADGGRVRTIALPKADGAAGVYPADLAVVDDDTIAVVDTASSRVLLLSVTEGAGEPIIVGADAVATAPHQPTAVARLDDGIAVADGGDHVIRVYDATGGYLRSLGDSLTPPLSFVGGMSLVGGRLYVADSNAGRVIMLDPETGAQVGTLPERVKLPRGIGPAGTGRVLVVASFGRTLSLYDAVGRLRAAVTSDTEAFQVDARLVLPNGVAWMAPAGRAYVTDAGDGRIRVYNVASGAKP